MSCVDSQYKPKYTAIVVVECPARAHYAPLRDVTPCTLFPPVAVLNCFTHETAPLELDEVLPKPRMSNQCTDCLCITQPHVILHCVLSARSTYTDADAKDRVHTVPFTVAGTSGAPNGLSNSGYQPCGALQFTATPGGHTP